MNYFGETLCRFVVQQVVYNIKQLDFHVIDLL